MTPGGVRPMILDGITAGWSGTIDTPRIRLAVSQMFLFHHLNR